MGLTWKGTSQTGTSQVIDQSYMTEEQYYDPTMRSNTSLRCIRRRCRLTRSSMKQWHLMFFLGSFLTYLFCRHSLIMLLTRCGMTLKYNYITLSSNVCFGVYIFNSFFFLYFRVAVVCIRPSGMDGRYLHLHTHQCI